MYTDFQALSYSLHTSKAAYQAGAYPGFCTM